MPLYQYFSNQPFLFSVNRLILICLLQQLVSYPYYFTIIYYTIISWQSADRQPRLFMSVRLTHLGKKTFPYNLL